MKTKDYVFCLVAVSLSFVPLGASAQLYRWVDDSGRTMVTDTPPPPKVKVEKIGKIRSEDPKPAATDTKAQVAEEKPDQTAQCVQAKKNIQLLESGQALDFVNAKGERISMDAPGRAAELARLREIIKNCAS